MNRESKTYRISQFAASVSAIPLFEIEGSDLSELRVEAAKKIESLSKAGVPLLPCLYCETEILPDTLANRAEFGKGQSRRKARRLMRSGRYTGSEQLSAISGRWVADGRKR